MNMNLVESGHVLTAIKQGLIRALDELEPNTNHLHKYYYDVKFHAEISLMAGWVYESIKEI